MKRTTRKPSTRSEAARIYAVADDAEKQFLDQLRERAGIIWNCRDADDWICWTNMAADKTCGRCGKKRPRRKKA